MILERIGWITLETASKFSKGFSRFCHVEDKHREVSGNQPQCSAKGSIYWHEVGFQEGVFLGIWRLL
jgi:hypothetical protein